MTRTWKPAPERARRIDGEHDVAPPSADAEEFTDGDEPVDLPHRPPRRVGRAVLVLLVVVGALLIITPFGLAKVGVFAALDPTSPPRPTRTPTTPTTKPGAFVPGSGQFYEAGPVNLAADRPASATSEVNGNPADEAVDGNVVTWWESVPNAFPQSITVDLGAALSIGRLELGIPTTATTPLTTETIEVDGDTGAGFFTILGPRSYRFDPNQGGVLSISLPSTTTRDVRLVFSSNSVGDDVQLATFEVYPPGP